MAKTPDFTKTFADMMANFPVDTSSYQEALKSQGALGEKLAKVALGAAERSTEISAQWAKDTISRMGELTSAKAEPLITPKPIPTSLRLRPKLLPSTWPPSLKLRRKFRWTPST